MFASLVALAYTATVGFRSIAYARERVVQRSRTASWRRSGAGVHEDPNRPADVGSCRRRTSSTAAVYRSCTDSSRARRGRRSSSGGVAATPWIYPHSGAVVGAAISNNVGYTWSTYITNNDPATQPYRVTVIVQWSSAAYPNKTNNLIRVQSLFASPAGCVSSSTHPFAAPCQPFFYGLAQVPAGKITVTGVVALVQHRLPADDGTESNLRTSRFRAMRRSRNRSRRSPTRSGRGPKVGS